MNDHPAAGPQQPRGHEHEAVGVGRVGVEDVEAAAPRQQGDPQRSRRIHLGAHWHLVDRRAGPPRPLDHRAARPADRLGAHAALAQAPQEVDHLLLAAPPGSCGVDVEHPRLGAAVRHAKVPPQGEGREFGAAAVSA